MPVTFGTGGLRGIMAAGDGYMNEMLVERASRGLAAYLLEKDAQAACRAGVAIAFDTRHNSQAFAQRAAQAIARMGIPVWLYMEAVPTPVLSYTITSLGCMAGVVVTASHNRKEYNGYKVYNEHGHQLTLEEADAVARWMEAEVKYPNAEPAKTRHVPEAQKHAFLKAVSPQSRFREAEAKAALRIVYTPLHGTGRWFVNLVLAQNGFTDIHVMAEQSIPDGDFPTVISPNPENHQALSVAIGRAQLISADLVLGTDPDCDRVGVAVLHESSYHLISGNQMGALLMDYVLAHTAEVPANGAVVKTIVTNDLGARIAEDAGLKVFETLTGFKYIGELMVDFARTGAYKFVFGYEESYGYLIGEHAHDKDAVVSSLLIAEMTAWHKQEGRTLVDALHALYRRYGWYADALDTIGIASISQVEQIMARLRTDDLSALGKVREVQDYKDGFAGLPPSDVLKFLFVDGAWMAIRPSGTEPILKIYYSAIGDSRETAQARLAQLREGIQSIVKQ